MEKMDSNRGCQHPKKAFCLITKATMSDPPMEEVPWICSDCGQEGVDIKTRRDPDPTYGVLMAKKARGGFGRR